ncbi:MAG: Crp/Fnr family transcriptional regulator [Sulfurospirillum sp.]|nr:Crp/Fnr family transcriptional regulator [Sulfurospirillum sp.]
MHNIRQIPLFAKLDDASIDKLREISSVHSYNVKEILFYEGDAPIYMYILLSGTLRLYKTNFKGAQIFLHTFRPINLVAELANFESMPYPASAEFSTKGEVMRIDYKKLEENFFKNPDISISIIKSLAAKLKIMSEVITNEVVLTSEGKIAKFLFENEKLFNELKQTQIAALLNITPETLSRTLGKFKKQKIIDSNAANEINIINKDLLSELFS